MVLSYSYCALRWSPAVCVSRRHILWLSRQLVTGRILSRLCEWWRVGVVNCGHIHKETLSPRRTRPKHLLNPYWLTGCLRCSVACDLRQNPPDMAQAKPGGDLPGKVTHSSIYIFRYERDICIGFDTSLLFFCYCQLNAKKRMILSFGLFEIVEAIVFRGFCSLVPFVS